MGPEVCDSHFAAGDEGGGSSKKSDEDKRTSNDFNCASNEAFRRVNLNGSAEYSKIFLCAMTDKHQRRHDLHRGIRFFEVFSSNLGIVS